MKNHQRRPLATASAAKANDQSVHADGPEMRRRKSGSPRKRGRRSGERGLGGTQGKSTRRTVVDIDGESIAVEHEMVKGEGDGGGGERVAGTLLESQWMRALLRAMRVLGCCPEASSWERKPCSQYPNCRRKAHPILNSTEHFQVITGPESVLCWLNLHLTQTRLSNSSPARETPRRPTARLAVAYPRPRSSLLL